MIAAEVLDAMLQAGCTAEQIVAAVKADAAIEERKRDEKRAKDAERQRKHRGKNSVSRDVTVTNGDGRDTLDKKGPHTPKKINPNPPPISPQFCDRIVESWNLAASRTELPSARKLNPERCTKLRRRLKSFSEAEMLEAIAKLASSPFHCGENDRGWKADIGWLLKSDENVTKALEIRPKATSPPVDPLVAKILARESAASH